jgi:uncharacterized SAM-binding protein YcdF (DUF218 family)
VFVLKKIVSQLLLPMPLCFTIIFLGLMFLWFTKKQKTGKVLVSVGFAVFLLLSYGVGTDKLLLSFEKEFPPYDGKRGAEFVVVLAGAIISDPNIPATSQLNSSSISRMVEGIIIYRKNPGSKIIFSGESVAPVMGRIAVEMGVGRNDIIIEAKSRDTNNEAKMLKSIVGEEKFILVTSASHMLRSMIIFKGHGMNPIPAPAEFLVKEKGLDLYSFFPGATALKKAEKALYEYLGLVSNKLVER